MPKQMTLRQLRRLRDITQAQMAERLGITTATYASWEKCPAKVKTGRLLQVLQILGCSIYDLKIFGEGGKVPYIDRGE